MYIYLFNPGELIGQKPKAATFIMGFVISALAFALFYLQTAIDTDVPIIYSLIKGVLFGTIGIALASILIWLIVKMVGNTAELFSVMSIVSLSYFSTLIFTLVGLLLYFSFGWNTAMTCGITGVLAAFVPMSGAITRLCKGKQTLNIMIVTCTGMYALLFWGILNNLI